MSAYGNRPTVPHRRGKGLPLRKIIPIALGVLVLVCGLALCGMNVADPGGKGEKQTAQPPAGQPQEQQSGTGGGGGTPASPVPTNTAVVPDLVGLNAAVAGDQLKHLGFKHVEYASGDKRYKVVIVPQNWSVTKQSAPAGTHLARDALIVLTCVKPA